MSSRRGSNTQVSSSIPFDNSVTNLNATNIQELGEEFINSPIGCLDIMVFNENGIARNQWLESYRNSIPSNESPQVLPFDAKLIAVTYSNSAQGSDTDIQIHKSSLGSGSTLSLVTTLQVRASRVSRFSNITPISFNAGDKIAVYLQDQGIRTTNVVIKLYFLIDNHNKEDIVENY